jgi:uncharacterized protein (TIGR02145 family)
MRTIFKNQGTPTFFLIAFLGAISLNAQRYPSVEINGQVWMAENLSVQKFRNGDPIPLAESEYEWNRAYETRRPACSYTRARGGSGAGYGLLYNWWAVTDPRGLAPVGWHVPSSDEWQQLVDGLGGAERAGLALRGAGGWKTGGAPADYSNSSGFSALPAGYRVKQSGHYMEQGWTANWWTRSRFKTNPTAWSMSFAGPAVKPYGFDPSDGLSVRCIRGELIPDNEPED